jgi:hypothetical protein
MFGIDYGAKIQNKDMENLFSEIISQNFSYLGQEVCCDSDPFLFVT